MYDVETEPAKASAMKTAPGIVPGPPSVELRLADAATGDHAVDQQDDDRPADGQQPSGQ
jgi:hypothetical protein